MFEVNLYWTEIRSGQTRRAKGGANGGADAEADAIADVDADGCL